MFRKKALITLFTPILLGLVLLGATFKVGNAPLLGLDLEGGISVVLSPQGQFTDEQLDQAISIMQQRINSIGVAEPDIYKQGGTIVVQIAGIKDEDKDKAIALVGRTAELRFRPVLQNLLADPTEAAAANAGTTVPGATTTVPPSTAPGDASTTTLAAPTTASTPAAPTTTAAAAPTTTAAGSPAAAPAEGRLDEGESAAGAVAQQAPTTAAPPTTAAAPSTTAAPTDPGTPTTAPAATVPPAAVPTALATTPPEVDNLPQSATQTVVLVSNPLTNKGGTARYQLGPACLDPNKVPDSCLTGRTLSSARAGLDETKWAVFPAFKGGGEGIDLFNQLAAKCFSKAPECPTGQMAITLDGQVITAPSINNPTYQADQINISGSFDEESAKDVATALQYGALPVQLKQETSESVSATLGRDALTAGLIAGLVGFIAVTAYMIAFYRVLGALSIVKLALEGVYLWVIISYLGSNAGLALTLAGVTGIIVSIGTSLDSNIVYYEHLREDIRNGRSQRSAIERSFSTAFSTILKADGASLLGAILLYWLAVGPVRGFAFYLGLSTALDLLGSFFYMRPVVYLTGNSSFFLKRPALLGLPPTVATSGSAVSPTRDGAQRTRRGASGTARAGTAVLEEAPPEDETPPDDGGSSPSDSATTKAQ